MTKRKASEMLNNPNIRPAQIQAFIEMGRVEDDCNFLENCGLPPIPEIPVPAKPPAAKVINLPIWPENNRGTPNSFMRGALFAAIQGKDRRYLKGELLASREGMTIRFTGMQLDQSDLDVWEQAVEMAKNSPLGNECYFSMYGFLKGLERPTGKAQHEWLKDSLRRLTATCVEIKHSRYSYGGNLLEFVHDEETNCYRLSLNPKLIALYQAGWTQVDWGVRQKLRRKPLALWLHSYLSSDAENYPTKIETLHRLSGSSTKDLKHFKTNLKSALADLEALAGIQSTIDGDFVIFSKH